MNITKILQGINRCEVEYTDGWWETESGASFGHGKLIEAQGYECGLLQRITELQAQLADAKQDAARWQAVKPMFRTMSANIDGNHTWTLAYHGSLKGASMDDAADKVIQAEGKA